MEDLDLRGRIILKQIFKMWDGEAWIALICLRTRTGGWALVSAVINLWISESASAVRLAKLLRKDSAPWGK